MSPATRSRSQNEGKPDICLNWLFIHRGQEYTVQTIDIPYSLFDKRGGCRELLALKLESQLGFQADLRTIRFWKPKTPLLTENVDETREEVTEKDIKTFATEIQPAQSLSTALKGKEKEVDIVHIIVTSERRLISLTWCFFSPGYSLLEINVTEIFRDLFTSPSHECRGLFSNRLRSDLQFHADPDTISFWKLKNLLSVTEMRQRKSQILNDVLQNFADRIEPGKPLSTELNGKEENIDIVHVIVNAERLISLNCCFVSPHLSLFKFGIVEVSRYLFNGPSQECQKLFSDHLPSQFRFHADPDAVNFWKFRDPLSAAQVQERKAELLGTDLHDLADEIVPWSPLSTEIEGRVENKAILHLLVRVEGANEHDDERRDEVGDLPEIKRFQEAVAAQGRAPSTTAILNNFRDNQKSTATRIYDGHYPPNGGCSTIAPPVQIYHPIFNKFLDLIDSRLPTMDDLKATRELMEYLGELSSVEESVRNAVINQHLSSILRLNMQASQNADRTMPDGVISVVVGGVRVPLLIAEFKRMLGEGHCDPMVQASLSMQRRWKMNDIKDVLYKCCCPTFLLAGGGPWLGILGAVFPDRVIVQPLTELRWFGIGSTEEDGRIYKNAQILVSLRQALQGLERYYLVELARTPSHTDRPLQRVFPYPTSYTDDNERVEFKYMGYLEKAEGLPCVTFLAEVVSVVVDKGQKTTVKVGETIVVKYVSRYGKEAHKFLAGLHYAPKLLYHGPLPDSPTSASHEGDGLCRMDMVVMEYINGDVSFELPDHCREKLKKALFELHAEGYAFGDLRNQNILIDSAGSAKLIDFNWCGEYDTSKDSSLDGVPEDLRQELKGRLKPRRGPFARYPLTISMGRQIDWANGVGPHAFILPGHDWVMLERLS